MDVIRLQTSVANLFIQHCLQVGLGRIGQDWAKKRATKFFNSDFETQLVDTHFRSLFTAETAQEFYLIYSKMNVYHQFLSVN